MKARPMLFAGPMVRAEIEGRKTMTRRAMKPQPEATHDGYPYWHIGGYRAWEYMAVSDERRMGTHNPLKCPYGKVGDLLLASAEIPGVPKTYCAGSDGRIYSKARGDWRPLKEWRTPKGYQAVTIMDGGRKRSVTVHRLVCSAFYGAPSAGAQVRHLDGNPENGAPSNLAWGSQEDNWLDRRAHGHGIEGEKHHAAKFSDDEREHIRWALSRGMCSQRGAAKALGVSQCAIHGIAAGNELKMVEQLIPASRIPTTYLRITDVRVERLQDISEADALAEGIHKPFGSQFWHSDVYGSSLPGDTPIWAFRNLWESINGDGSWAANPWVWRIEFAVIRKNVDDVMRGAA